MIVHSLFRRAAWALLAIGLAGVAAADSYHPHILKSQVVKLDADAIERNAKSGAPFTLVLGDVQFDLVLSPAPLFPKEGLPVFEVGKDGGVTKRVVATEITYAGDVVGEDPKTTEARFAISRGVLDGFVLSSTGWWFIEPLSRFDPKAGRDEYLVYATRDLEFELPYGDDGVNGDTVIDHTRDDGRIPVTMVADSLYISLSGESFTFDERQAALLNKINGIYIDQTGRRFGMQAVVGDNAGFHLTSTNSVTLLNQIRPFLDIFGGLQTLQSEIAHLTTAKNLDGTTIGRAFQPGRFGLSQQAVVFAGGGGGGGGAGPALAYQNLIIASHEIGHNFDGDHNEADEWCVTEFIICLDYERTIMWPTIYGDTNPRFSDGTRDPNHNNQRRIREEMAARGF